MEEQGRTEAFGDHPRLLRTARTVAAAAPELEGFVGEREAHAAQEDHQG